MDSGSPDPRWNEFIEQYDQDARPIGFKLPGKDFLFKYDIDGGWEDEDGNYYNADGVLEEQAENSADEHQDELSEHDDDEVVDEFQKMLRQQEEGRPRKELSPKKEEEQKKEEKPKKESNQFDYDSFVEQYKNKQRLREGLPAELFIYFKQRSQRYEEISPVIEKLGSTELKNATVKQIKAKVDQKRKILIAQNEWLNQEGAYLDFSGDSEEEQIYDRYWFGSIKTTAEKYLEILEQIRKSKEFKILQIKTFYALKSKFYLKKAEKTVKDTIAELKAKIDVLDASKSASLLIDGLPKQFPCSLIYDLVQFAGGKLEQVESVIIEDDFSATITCQKPTALALINIEGYNHDKGEYIQIEFKGAKDRAYLQGKHQFYYITVDSEYKLHESELHDTLALQLSKTGVAKTFTKEQHKVNNIRFVLGSIQALRRVLMFRGVTLNVVVVLPSVPVVSK